MTNPASVPGGDRNWKGMRRTPPLDLQSWYLRRLESILFKALPGWGTDGIEGVARYLADREAGLVWEDYEHYVPGHYSKGCWVISESVVKAMLPAAIEAWKLHREAELYPTLDDWLAAFSAGKPMEPGIHEPMPVQFVPTPQPRRCTKCRKKFPELGDRRVKVCSECRTQLELGRSKRDLDELTALAKGATFLKWYLAELGIDPTDPSDLPDQPGWSPREEVASWLAGTARPKGGRWLTITRKYWRLSEQGKRIVGWAFRPAAEWPEAVRPELSELMYRMEQATRQVPE